MNPSLKETEDKLAALHEVMQDNVTIAEANLSKLESIEKNGKELAEQGKRFKESTKALKNTFSRNKNPSFNAFNNPLFTGSTLILSGVLMLRAEVGSADVKSLEVLDRVLEYGLLLLTKATGVTLTSIGIALFGGHFMPTKQNKSSNDFVASLNY